MHGVSPQGEVAPRYAGSLEYCADPCATALAVTTTAAEALALGTYADDPDYNGGPRPRAGVAHGLLSGGSRSPGTHGVACPAVVHTAHWPGGSAAVSSAPAGQDDRCSGQGPGKRSYLDHGSAIGSYGQRGSLLAAVGGSMPPRGAP